VEKTCYLFIVKKLYKLLFFFAFDSAAPMKCKVSWNEESTPDLTVLHLMQNAKNLTSKPNAQSSYKFDENFHPIRSISMAEINSILTNVRALQKEPIEKVENLVPVLDWLTYSSKSLSEKLTCFNARFFDYYYEQLFVLRSKFYSKVVEFNTDFSWSEICALMYNHEFDVHSKFSALEELISEMQKSDLVAFLEICNSQFFDEFFYDSPEIRNLALQELYDFYKKIKIKIFEKMQIKLPRKSSTLFDLYFKLYGSDLIIQDFAKCHVPGPDCGDFCQDECFSMPYITQMKAFREQSEEKAAKMSRISSEFDPFSSYNYTQTSYFEELRKILQANFVFETFQN